MNKHRHKKNHARPIVPIHGPVGTQQQQQQQPGQQARHQAKPKGGLHSPQQQQQQQQKQKQKQQQQRPSKPPQQQQHSKPGSSDATAGKKRPAPATAVNGLAPNSSKKQKHSGGSSTGQQQQQPAQSTPPAGHGHKQQLHKQPQRQQVPALQQAQQPQAGAGGAKGGGSKKRKRAAADTAALLPPPQSSAPAAAAAAAGGGGLPAPPKKPWHPAAGTAVGSNWAALQQALKAQEAANPKPRRPHRGGGAAAAADGAAGDAARRGSDGGKQQQQQQQGSSKKQIGSIGHNHAVTRVLALDCEMVGVGPGGERDSLARVSLVNASGNVLLDTFVAQKEAVTDYRTWVSGVTPQSLAGAPGIEQVQRQVCELTAGRVLVGHSLNKDLRVLMLSHPHKDIRDTAKYPPFMYSKGGKRKPRALRHLAEQELGLTIQQGQHSSVDDARAALYLYQKHAAAWERALKTPGGLKHLATANQRRPNGSAKRVPSYGAKDVTHDHMADL